jgi:threonine aldolase
MSFNRRSFLKASGLSALPILGTGLPAIASIARTPAPQANDRPVQFISDGEMYSASAYLQIMQDIHAAQPITKDIYGEGGVVDALEKKFMAITGKEKAMFMPSGTMANQLALFVLSGDNPKIFVQETSHVYRDEADAAQTVHNRRLIPLAKGQTGFTLEELQEAVEYHKSGEAFNSGIGAVSIENPVRRAEGRMIPIEELRKISAYCRKEGFKMHLDGARLHMASAWSGVSIAEYASLFDTVYVSLYKYLGAPSGAMLCGSKAVIDKMTHLVKIHGGAMFGNWNNAAIALKQLDGMDVRLQKARKQADELIARLNQLPQLKITPLSSGTNIHLLQYANGVYAPRPIDILAKEYNIRTAQPNKNGQARFIINETILYQDVDTIYSAFKKAFG